MHKPHTEVWGLCFGRLTSVCARGDLNPHILTDTGT